ncbi:unnamed protein product [Lepeophtheirus salmonis]|uniref:(salmon louse) hypothetical protein n=1 Tax=Lepeophtheirus salmonis TaxID=72036 RepID=A0A7R8CYI8_LEPSM|nr:unnamed protein product [Lepeophtheirus salmonis]CAF2968944.1 unnamed protein product [Lepeophtheirus salmonis]
MVSPATYINKELLVMMILKSTSRNYPDIMLPKIGESIVCGRSRESKLKDTKISKQHIRIIVIDSTRIEILQLGSNNSSLDDDRLILRRGHRSLLNVNSTFKFLSGTDYEYKLTMIKNDDKKSCSENTKKSSLSNNSKKIEKHWSLGLISSMSNPSNQLYKDDSMVIIEDNFPRQGIIS